jgi:hypothetical protein
MDNGMGFLSKTRTAKIALFLAAIGAQAPAATVARQPANSSLPWYEKAAAIHRVTLKPTTEYWRFENLAMDPARAAEQMRAWKEQGIDVIEIFAPEEGGNSYDGLDAKDRFKLDPGLGSVKDFQRLVGQAHSIGLSVVTFQNLGYAALDSRQFEKAEEDMREGRRSRETQFFYWSDTADQKPPATGDSYFLVRPQESGYDPTKVEFWQWSDKAERYYWTRWPGKDASGRVTHLPQYNWSSLEWPREAALVVSFWMSTGLDGMIVDAVNWYVGANWRTTDGSITGILHSNDDKLMLPEGGGAFHTDDPVGWITEGHWTSVYDYGLDIWWEKDSSPLRRSINTGDPGVYEAALRGYHDRVVAAGGVLVQPVPNFEDPGKQQLAEGLLATSGDMLCYCDNVDSITRPANGVPALLKLKAAHSALFQNSNRRRVPTNDDSRFYATVRDAADKSERLLVIFNFRSDPGGVDVDLGAIKGNRYWDIESAKPAAVEAGKLRVRIERYGHRIFQVTQ